MFWSTRKASSMNITTSNTPVRRRAEARGQPRHTRRRRRPTRARIAPGRTAPATRPARRCQGRWNIPRQAPIRRATADTEQETPPPPSPPDSAAMTGGQSCRDVTLRWASAADTGPAGGERSATQAAQQCDDQQRRRDDRLTRKTHYVRHQSRRAIRSRNSFGIRGCDRRSSRFTSNTPSHPKADAICAARSTKTNRRPLPAAATAPTWRPDR